MDSEISRRFTLMLRRMTQQDILEEWEEENAVLRSRIFYPVTPSLPSFNKYHTNQQADSATNGNHARRRLS